MVASLAVATIIIVTFSVALVYVFTQMATGKGNVCTTLAVNVNENRLLFT